VGEQSGALSNLRVGPYIGGDPAAFARAALGKNGKSKSEKRKPKQARSSKAGNRKPVREAHPTPHSPRFTPHAPPSTALVPIAPRSTPIAPRSVKSGPLSSSERRELDKLEAVVAKAELGFVASAHALKTIEETELWRGEFPSFPLYLRDRWGYSYSYVCKLIKAATVAERATPIAEKLGVVLRTESHFRELRDLEPDDVPEVLRSVSKRVLKDAEGKCRPTAAELKAAVKEYTTPEDDAHQEATPKAAIAAAAKDVGRGEESVGRGMFARGPQSIAAGTPGATGSASAVIDVTPRRVRLAEEDPFLEEVRTTQGISSCTWNGEKPPYAAALNDLSDRIRRLAELAGSGYPRLTNDLASLLRSIANEIEPAALRRKAK
jgi:hypothetical protein